MPSKGTMAGTLSPMGGGLQRLWNDATGGTITTFTSTGQTGTVVGGIYRVHTFTASGTFTVTRAVNGLTFDYFICAPGGGGMMSQTPQGGNGGNGGSVRQVLGTTLSAGAISTTCNLFGHGGNFGAPYMFGEGTSANAFGGDTAAGAASQSGLSGAAGSNGTNAGSYDFDGTSKSYGIGGNASPGGVKGTDYQGIGGSGGPTGGNVGGDGGYGVVMARYRIG